MRGQEGRTSASRRSSPSRSRAISLPHLALMPNPSLKLTRYGMRCKPRLQHMVHHCSLGLQRTPPRAA